MYEKKTGIEIIGILKSAKLVVKIEVRRNDGRMELGVLLSV